MTRNLFGTLYLTFGVLFLYALCLYIFRDLLGPGNSPYAPIVLALAVTALVTGVFRAIIYTLRRRGGNR